MKVILLLAAGFIASQAQVMDPVEALRRIESDREAKVRKALEDRQASKIAEIDKEASEAALKILAGVVRASIPPADAMSWAPLYERAGRSEDAKELLRGFLRQPSSSARRFDAQVFLMRLASQDNDGQEVHRVLLQTTPESPAQAATLGSYFGGTFHFYIHNAAGASAALEAAERLERYLPKPPYASDQLRKDVGWARRQVASAKAYYLAELGRPKDAVAALDEALRILDKDVFRREELNGERQRYEYYGQTAPEIVPVASHGDFRGLAANKGKVVLIEFTAHWCHACHKAIPGLKQLRQEFPDDRFEMVALTTYYGFFGSERMTERDMTREREFSLMPSLLEEQGVTWPMVYVEQPTIKAYGVTGIPHMVLLDKAGKIKRIDTGYSPEKLDRLRTAIRTLIAE